jgi:rhodanese-related sulfurtransferase
VKSITVGELGRQLENETAPFLLDVRDPEELADGAIEGSVNIPMDEIEKRLDDLPTDRDIIVICHVGARSARVARRLNELGYDRAVNLSGGMDAWVEASPEREASQSTTR